MTALDELNRGQREGFREVANRLDDFRRQLYRFEYATNLKFQASLLEPKHIEIDKCLRWKERHPAKTLPGNLVGSCLSDFATWAYISAFSETYREGGAGPSSLDDDVGLGSLVTALEDPSREYAPENYLHAFVRFGSQLGQRPGAAGGKIPNASIWALGASSSLDLVASLPPDLRTVENPRAALTFSEDLERIDRVGQQLRALLDSIVLDDRGRRSPAVLLSIMERVAALNRGFDQAVDGVETKVRMELSPPVKEGPAIVDLLPHHNIRPVHEFTVDIFEAKERARGKVLVANTGLLTAKVPPAMLVGYLSGTFDTLIATLNCDTDESGILRLELRFEEMTSPTQAGHFMIKLTIVNPAGIDQGDKSGPNVQPLALHNPERYKKCIESAVRNWDSGANLQAQFARAQTPTIYYSLRSGGLFGDNTKEDWESRLDAYVGPVRDKQRAALQKAMQAKLGSLDMTTAARVMDFTEAILRAYIYLGLPESLESDELLRALLFGERKKLIGGGEQLAVTQKAYLDDRWRLDVDRMRLERDKRLRTLEALIISRLQSGDGREFFAPIDGVSQRVKLWKPILSK